ncbi:MAG: hypothetical protein V7785_20405 [Bermanella sp.]
MDISAAETLNLTAVNDMNLNTAQKLTAKAKKKIDVSTDDKLAMTAEKDMTLKTKAKCYLGNDDVNLVQAVSDLADQVNKIAAFTGAQLYGGTLSAAIPGNPAELAGPLVTEIKTGVDGLL